MKQARRSMMTLTALSILGLLNSCGEKKPEKSATSTPVAPAATTMKVLKFSAIPNQNATQLKEKFDPLAQFLSGELGVPVEFVPVSDYKASVELFKNGQIYLAWFGGVTGVQARAAVPGAQAIAQGEEDMAFKSYFIAHKDAGLTRSVDFPTAISGMKFTFGSESSTSGRVMPSYYIQQITGQPIEAFFKEKPSFSGSHDKTCELVASGQFQVGVVDYTVYEARVKEGKTDPTMVSVIWETPHFMDYNFTVHPALEKDYGTGFTAKLANALYAINTKKPELLQAFPRKKLIPVKNEDFALLEENCRELGFLR
jgi:phosphonate transport system substrate-binding protein